jgi:hypothetical protein
MSLVLPFSPAIPGASPCHLLTTSQQHTLGFGPKRLATSANGVCALVQPPPADQLTDPVALRLTIDLSGYPYPLLGAVSRQPFRASDGRGGVTAEDQTTGECEVTLPAAAGYSVLILVLSGGGAHADCLLAAQAAAMISPELPRSGRPVSSSSPSRA